MTQVEAVVPPADRKKVLEAVEATTFIAVMHGANLLPKRLVAIVAGQQLHKVLCLGRAC